MTLMCNKKSVIFRKKTVLMDASRKKFKRMEIIGAVAVSLCAALFHFTYEFSGDNFFVGLISAVNESVWEHTKIIYFPFLFYAIIEYLVVKPKLLRFFIAQTVSLAFITLITITFFYTYTGMFGGELLILDIICTVIWASLAFMISYKLYYSKYNLEKYKMLYILLFCGQLAIQLLFTPFVPHIPLFMDPESGVYGFPA